MKNSFWLLPLLAIFACSGPKEEELPILGPREFTQVELEGISRSDTIYYSIPNFRFLNQDSLIISNKLTAGKVYVADFFFTSCPTICPKMKRNMLDLYKTFENDSQVIFLSHSIDPKRDSVLKLRDYAARLEVSSEKWHFLTGDKSSLFEIAKGYMVSADEDPKAPGGFIHSGAFILVDKEGRIRAYYDGTLKEDTELLKNDIKKLLADSQQ